MAKDNEASYFRIGLTVIVGIAAIIAVLIRIGGLGGKANELFAETYYDKPVPGLTVGSAVNFRGVKIGEVRKIDFIGNMYEVEGAENSRIYILMALDRRLLGESDNRNLEEDLGNMVKRLGLRATVTTSGITGMSRIECDFYRGEQLHEARAISWTPKHVYIPPNISLLDSFSDSATKVMNQINKMDLGAAWSNVSAAVESVAHMTDSAKNIIDARQADMERLLDDLSATSAAVRDLVLELKRDPSMLIRSRVQQPLSETVR